MKLTLKTINNTAGNPEYVLIPIFVYKILKRVIDKSINEYKTQEDYDDFNPADFIKNKIALARMKAKMTQSALAKKLKVSQAYISKIENDDYSVTNKLFLKINAAIKK